MPPAVVAVLPLNVLVFRKKVPAFTSPPPSWPASLPEIVDVPIDNNLPIPFRTPPPE